MKTSALEVQAAREGYMPAGHASASAGDMAAAHGSYTMQLADGQHNGYEQTGSMAYDQQAAALTNEQLAAAYAASLIDICRGSHM